MATDTAGGTDTGHYHTVALARRFKAPADRLWNAWAQSELLARWFSESAEQDFTVGGRYSNADGDEGEFLEIIPRSKLRFTWEQPDYEPGSIVTVEFSPVDEDASEIRLTHERVACGDAEDLEIGWRDALDTLARYLETSNATGAASVPGTEVRSG